MKTQLSPPKRGFTLLELTIAIMMGMAIGAMTLALFNQQLAFLRIFRAQNFLTEEAPMISMYISRLVGKADRFRLHDSVADAMANRNARDVASPVVLLNFRQPDGTMKATILAFEARDGTNGLYYYVVPDEGPLAEPQWAVTTVPSLVQFSMEQGVLRVGLTGPNGEGITYSGTMQQ